MSDTTLGKLTRRAEYLAANGGRRAPTPGFILLVRPRGDDDPAIRLGITVSRKVGGAVVRNRMRRRFRELARAVLPQAGIAGADHVMIGRAAGIERPFAELRADLEKALRRISTKHLRPRTGSGAVEARSLPSIRARKGKSRPPPGSGRTETGSEQ